CRSLITQLPDKRICSNVTGQHVIPRSAGKYNLAIITGLCSRDLFISVCAKDLITTGFSRGLTIFAFAKCLITTGQGGSPIPLTLTIGRGLIIGRDLIITVFTKGLITTGLGGDLIIPALAKSLIIPTLVKSLITSGLGGGLIIPALVKSLFATGFGKDIVPIDVSKGIEIINARLLVIVDGHSSCHHCAICGTIVYRNCNLSRCYICTTI